MSNHLALARALADLQGNPEQYDAACEHGHCVVLAGPGGGKTKTLTHCDGAHTDGGCRRSARRCCITYNNECAIELEMRLAKLGIESSDRSFIGTVHSFALTQVIAPYAHCIVRLFPDDFRVATRGESRDAIEIAYEKVFNDAGNPHDRWRFAEEKRRRDVDRNLPSWRGSNHELADFIEAYEDELRHSGLIDFEYAANRFPHDQGSSLDPKRAASPFPSFVR